MKSALCAAVVALAWTATGNAGEVKLEGVHLCCGLCVKAVTQAISETDGISNLKVDREARLVTFTAANQEAAQTGVNTLAKAGFAGKATHDGKSVPLPKGGDNLGKANEVTVQGLHNCCGGCQKAITAALEKVDGVKSVNCEKQTCKLSGTGIDEAAVIAALHASGLHGQIAK